jgi:ketosteroid isomerase-like protein
MTTSAELQALLDGMTAAAEARDSAGFAAAFTEDAVYHDYIYGDHGGRAEIRRMLDAYFLRDAADYRWKFFDAVCDGDTGYAWSLSRFTSAIPEFRGKQVVIDGMSRFVLRGGLIADYRESVNGGVAMAQLGVAPARMEKVFRKWGGWLRARPEVDRYLKEG